MGLLALLFTKPRPVPSKAEKARQEISRLKERIADLEEFVSACRYAGPDGIEQLKKEAQELLIRKR